MMSTSIADRSRVTDAFDARIDGLNWSRVERELAESGYAVLPGLLLPAECAEIIGLYENDTAFRSRIVMARHNFGRGEYKYFEYPLPPLVQSIRASAYPHLAPIANRWSERMKINTTFPRHHEAFLRQCHGSGQTRPTPLLLRYEAGDYNCLHQDIYGEHVFPLQITVLLSHPTADFMGGEFVLTEQRPRMQSRVEVVPLTRGDAVVFVVRERPVQGSRGSYRVNMRHGVSRIRAGERYTLGIIFHDAK
jgi:uncharacterized protein